MHLLDKSDSLPSRWADWRFEKLKQTMEKRYRLLVEELVERETPSEFARDKMNDPSPLYCGYNGYKMFRVLDVEISHEQFARLREAAIAKI